MGFEPCREEDEPNGCAGRQNALVAVVGVVIEVGGEGAAALAVAGLARAFLLSLSFDLPSFDEPKKLDLRIGCCPPACFEDEPLVFVECVDAASSEPS